MKETRSTLFLGLALCRPPLKLKFRVHTIHVSDSVPLRTFCTSLPYNIVIIVIGAVAPPEMNTADEVEYEEEMWA